MSGLSTYLAGAVLAWIKSTAMPADPAAVYVGLFDGDPTDAGSGGTEVTADITGAARIAVTFGAVTAKAMANNADVDFGTSDADVDVTHFGLFDADTAGNMLGSAALDTPRTIVTGDPVKFATGDFTFSLATP